MDATEYAFTEDNKCYGNSYMELRLRDLTAIQRTLPDNLLAEASNNANNIDADSFHTKMFALTSQRLHLFPCRLKWEEELVQTWLLSSCFRGSRFSNLVHSQKCIKRPWKRQTPFIWKPSWSDVCAGHAYSILTMPVSYFWIVGKESEFNSVLCVQGSVLCIRTFGTWNKERTSEKEPSVS